MNFFGLRLDGAADPTLRALAEASWAGWNESQPRRLDPGQWHLPFIDDRDVEESGVTSDLEWQEILPTIIKISVARSAHLSYESFSNPGARMNVAECVALHDRFAHSVPMHASPMEHHARATTWSGGWMYPLDGGNLGLGWRQYRKFLIGENVAPLPETYR
jgi:hypothetical protein